MPPNIAAAAVKRERSALAGAPLKTKLQHTDEHTLTETEAAKQEAKLRAWVTRWFARRRRHRLTAAMLFSTGAPS